MPSGRGHEAGLALSLPLASRATIGGTVKYFSLSGIERPRESHRRRHVRPRGDRSLLPKLSLAVVGTNLRNLHNSNAPPGDRLRGRVDPDARTW